MRSIFIGLAVLAVSACNKPPQQQANETAQTAEAGPQKGVDRSHRGEKAPNVSISSGSFESGNLGGIGIKPTLVNLWATWCAPCVKELPTLNRLAKEHAKDDDLMILAISQDSGPYQSVKAFLNSKAPDLDVYQDPKMELSAALGPDTVLPTTILYDANGREVWRYVGDLDWTSPEAAKLLSEAGAAPAKG